MRSKFISLLSVAVLTILAFGAGRVSAERRGPVDAPGSPTDPVAQMVTQEQIYTRLISGTFAISMTTFTEPSGAPGTGTMHTLNDLWAVAKPGAYAKRVAQTGQTQCWDSSGSLLGSCASTGQDGEYLMGITPVITPTGGTAGAYNTPPWTGARFTDNGNGTVTDNLTVLIWLKNANCFSSPSWAVALTDANALANGSCSLTDGSTAGQWRLPNINELHSLIDLSQINLALPVAHPFSGVQSGTYWSSTTYSGSTSFAWVVNLFNGDLYFNGKANTSYLWPVRGGQ